MKWLFIWFIRLYQKTLSPDHGPLRRFFPYGYCRFHPTCSDYGLESYKRFGVFKGTGLTVWRICRCNPFSAGGEDPVPQKKP